jgi:cytochrome c553
VRSPSAGEPDDLCRATVLCFVRLAALVSCLVGAASNCVAQAPANGQASVGEATAPIAVVKDLYAAFGRGDLQHIEELLSPEVVWTFHGPEHLIPYAGVYKGKDGVRQFFAAVAGTIDVREIGQRQFVQQGDTVAVVGWERSVVRETGGEFFANWLHLFTIKDGHIAGFEEFTDSAAIVGALAPAEPERGKAYYTTCAGCHGTDAQGNRGMHAPNLTPLDAGYLLRQLRHFAHDIRGGAQDFYGWQMNGRAKALPDDRALRDVVAFIETLPKTHSPASAGGNATRGAVLYAGCASCHGSNGEGNTDIPSPALAGLDDGYLIEQLESYVSGRRGAHKDDAQGAQMRAAAVILESDDARRDVVAYIATLPKGAGQPTH